MFRPTILITGASSGLGAEMARQFATLGQDLALCARRTDPLEALKAEISSAHPDRRVEVRALDVTDDEQVFEVFRSFRADFGTIDRVVVNAGLGKGAPLGTGRYDANRQTAVTNFLGGLAQVDDHLRRDQGRCREAGGGVARRALRQADQGVGALPRLHRLGDERGGRAGDAADGQHREGAFARWSTRSRRRRPPPACRPCRGAR